MAHASPLMPAQGISTWQCAPFELDDVLQDLHTSDRSMGTGDPSASGCTLCGSVAFNRFKSCERGYILLEQTHLQREVFGGGLRCGAEDGVDGLIRGRMLLELEQDCFRDRALVARSL